MEDNRLDVEPRVESLFKKKKEPTKSVGKYFKRKDEDYNDNDVLSFWGDLGKERKNEDKQDYW